MLSHDLMSFIVAKRRMGLAGFTTHRRLAADVLRVALVAVSVSLLAAAAALAVLRTWEPQYTASFTVGPTARSGGAGVGLRAAHVGGGAESVAEPGPADEVFSDFSRYLELLRALPTAQTLADDPAFMARLYPGRWDAAAQAWRPPLGVWAAIKGGVLRLAGRPAWTPPDAVALAETLRGRVIVEAVGTGPLRRVSFRHADRDFALAALERLGQTADRHLKAEAARRAKALIDHIRSRFDPGPMAEERRRALNNLLLEQEQVLTALGVDLPFAADMLEPAHAPAAPDWPDALMTTGASGVAGFALALAFYGYRLQRRHEDLA